MFYKLVCQKGVLIKGKRTLQEAKTFLFTDLKCNGLPVCYSDKISFPFTGYRLFEYSVYLKQWHLICSSVN